MTGTVTWAGLDVHARSTHAAAINVMTVVNAPKSLSIAAALAHGRC